MSLASARADLEATLSDTGYAVHAYGTPKVVSGSVVIDEAEPFLEYGDVQVAGAVQVNFNVYLFQDLRNEVAATKAMDSMVEKAVLNLGDWTLTNLRSHTRTKLKQDGPVFLVSVLSVTKQHKLLQTGDV